MLKFLPWVFIGGGIGASLRFILSTIIKNFTQNIWSGTLFVNVLGCCLIFLCEKYLGSLEKEWRTFITIGVLGSLTTFSSFSLEVFKLVEMGRAQTALLVIALNMFLGISCGFLIFSHKLMN